MHGSGKGYLIGLKTDLGMHLLSLLTPALCSRSFKEQCLVFLPTKKEAHRMRIIFGLLDLKATELHGALSQLQVHTSMTCVAGSEGVWCSEKLCILKATCTAQVMAIFWG